MSRLTSYRSKRKLRRSGEPDGGRHKHEVAQRGPLFVVQQHHATGRHFDFRLQVGRVLVSWAVPKGPSTDPRVKRLALQVEDHPLGYADFEGVIPEGEYGAGPVLLWDRGRYRNLRREGGRAVGMRTCVDDGLIEVWLVGHKLRGGWALKRIEKGAKPRWLLVKMRDEQADARRNPTRTQPRSVTSGLTISELARRAVANK